MARKNKTDIVMKKNPLTGDEIFHISVNPGEMDNNQQIRNYHMTKDVATRLFNMLTSEFRKPVEPALETSALTAIYPENNIHPGGLPRNLKFIGFIILMDSRCYALYRSDPEDTPAESHSYEDDFAGGIYAAPAVLGSYDGIDFVSIMKIQWVDTYPSKYPKSIITWMRNDRRNLVKTSLRQRIRVNNKLYADCSILSDKTKREVAHLIYNDNKL